MQTVSVSHLGRGYWATVILVVVVSTVFFVVSILTHSSIALDLRPWLTERPQFAWHVDACEDSAHAQGVQLPSGLNSVSVVSACVTAFEGDVLRFELAKPVIARGTFIEHSTDLLRVFPAISTDYDTVRLGQGEDPCFADLLTDPALGDTFTDKLVRVCGLDDREVPFLTVGQGFSDRSYLGPSNVVGIYQDILTPTLRAHLNGETTPIRWFAIASRFETGIEQLDDDFVIVPSGTAANARQSELDHLLVVRAVGAQDLDELAQVDAAIRAAGGDHLESFFSVLGADVRASTEVFERVLRLIDVLMWGLIATVVLLAIHNLVERERKLFTLARVSGFGRPAMYLFLSCIAGATFLFAVAIGGLFAVAIGELIEWWLPKVPFTWQWPIFAKALLFGLGLALAIALALLWVHFRRDIAAELERVAFDS